jgi:hypothetical protein
VVPARVNSDGGGGFYKGSIKGWPARASSDPAKWPDGWFTWGGDWWAALCPRAGGLVALDLDGPEAVNTFRRGVKQGEFDWPAEPPLAYRTPGHGGGMHFVWRWPPGLPPFSRKVLTIEKGGQIDLRGEGTFLLLCGAPRPDLPAGARYEVVMRPLNSGPPQIPVNVVAWMEELPGVVTTEEAPSLDVRQASPAQIEKMAAAQGGRIRVDRHTALFALASYLRVRQGTRTFEQLATALWQALELHFEIEDEVEHWQSEAIRVARNASKYTEERDRLQREAATSGLRALMGPRSS